MSKQSKLQPRNLAILALLLAMEIILSRFFSIQLPIIRVTFAFIPISAAGILFGPLPAALVAGLGDFMGAILFPAGAYFPGYTVTAFLTGLVYGLFLHRKVVTVWRVACAVGLIAVVLNLFVNTIWIQMTTGKAYLALLPTRIIKSVVMAPFQIVVIRLLASRLQGLEKHLFPGTAG